MEAESRRGFLCTAVVSAPAIGILGASTTFAQTYGHDRRAVPAAPEAPYSRATVFGPFVFVAGVLGTDPTTRQIPTGGFEAECIQTLENLKASVDAAGAKMANVMKCTCFLTDAADFPVFNKVFRAYFPSKPPARSTVVVKELVVAGAKIELDCTAVLA